MIKTAVENKQNLIIEGCYIPSDWEKDFSDKYLNEIRYYCLVMSQKYIEQHFSDIKKYAARLNNAWMTQDVPWRQLWRIMHTILKCVRNTVIHTY